jgi:hypothetical protein
MTAREQLRGLHRTDCSFEVSSGEDGCDCDLMGRQYQLCVRLLDAIERAKWLLVHADEMEKDAEHPDAIAKARADAHDLLARALEGSDGAAP